MGEDMFQRSFIVEDIIDKRIVNGKVQYLLKWLTFSNEHYSWVSETDCTPDALTEAYFQMNVSESKLEKFLSKMKKLNDDREACEEVFEVIIDQNDAQINFPLIHAPTINEFLLNWGDDSNNLDETNDEEEFADTVDDFDYHNNDDYDEENDNDR